MLKNTTISALALAAAIISAPAQASVNQTSFNNNLAKVNLNFVALEPGYAFTKSTARSPEAAPMVVAWSIKRAVKKAGKGIKKRAKKGWKKSKKHVVKTVKTLDKHVTVGGIRVSSALTLRPRKIRRYLRTTGRVLGAPYKKGKRLVRRIIKHPYGKRCRPGKYLEPICKVGSRKPRGKVQARRR